MADDYMDFEDEYFEEDGLTPEEMDRMDITEDDVEHTDAIRSCVIDFLERHDWEYELDEHNGIETSYRSDSGKEYRVKIYFSLQYGGSCGIYTHYDRRIPQRAWSKMFDFINRMNQELSNCNCFLDTIFDGQLSICSDFIADTSLPSDDKLYEYLYSGGVAFEKYDSAIRDVVMGRREPRDLAPKMEVLMRKEGSLPLEDHEEDWLDEVRKEKECFLLNVDLDIENKMNYRPGDRIQFMYQKGKFKKWKSGAGEEEDA